MTNRVVPIDVPLFAVLAIATPRRTPPPAGASWANFVTRNSFGSGGALRQSAFDPSEMVQPCTDNDLRKTFKLVSSEIEGVDAPDLKPDHFHGAFVLNLKAPTHTSWQRWSVSNDA